MTIIPGYTDSVISNRDKGFNCYLIPIKYRYIIFALSLSFRFTDGARTQFSKSIKRDVRFRIIIPSDQQTFISS